MVEEVKVTPWHHQIGWLIIGALVGPPVFIFAMLRLGVFYATMFQTVLGWTAHRAAGFATAITMLTSIVMVVGTIIIVVNEIKRRRRGYRSWW